MSDGGVDGPPEQGQSRVGTRKRKREHSSSVKDVEEAHTSQSAEPWENLLSSQTQVGSGCSEVLAGSQPTSSPTGLARGGNCKESSPDAKGLNQAGDTSWNFYTFVR